jgi:hypothetical protein
MSLESLAGSLGAELAAEVVANTIVNGGRSAPEFDPSKVTLTPSGVENILRSNKLEYLLADILNGWGFKGSALTGGFDSIQDRVEFGREQAAKSFSKISREWLEREVGRIMAESQAAQALANINRSYDRAINMDTMSAGMTNNALSNSTALAQTALNANQAGFDSAAKYASGLATAIGGIANTRI